MSMNRRRRDQRKAKKARTKRVYTCNHEQAQALDGLYLLMTLLILAMTGLAVFLALLDV